MQFKRVVVTGLGAVTPLGNNVNDYWTNLVAGTSGAAPITRFDATKFKTRFACEVKGVRHDTGNKFGYLRAMVYFALKREDLGEKFAEYLGSIGLPLPAGKR